ncbi:hypothetical protein JVU11DRAFT_10774 [Chiua virens]|nr:hypothetical protein JVU11DRAFT_10774 [Chiua virens]
MAIPSAHVTCANNAADLELSSHWKAQVATRPTEGDNTANTLAPGSEAGQKQTRKVINVDAAASSAESDAESPPKKKKGLQKDRACDATGSDGLLKDVQVIDVDEPTKRGQAEHTQDIDAHFSTPYLNSDNKKVRDCNTCSSKSMSLLSTKQPHCGIISKQPTKKCIGSGLLTMGSCLCYPWTPNATEMKKLINATPPCPVPSVGNLPSTVILCRQARLFSIRSLHFAMPLSSGSS